MTPISEYPSHLGELCLAQTRGGAVRLTNYFFDTTSYS